MGRLSGPAQEVHDILGHLGLGAWSAILIVNKTVGVQRVGHSDEASWVVWIVVKAITSFDASWRISVAKEQGEDVVNTLVLCSRVHAQIWRVGTAVGITGSLLVWVRRWESIHEDGRSSEHLTLVIWPVDDIIAGSKLLHALLRKHMIHEMPKVKLLHGVASGAHLAVDLIAAADAGDLVAVENGLDPERIARRVGWVLVLTACWCSVGGEEGCSA